MELSMYYRYICYADDIKLSTNTMSNLHDSASKEVRVNHKAYKAIQEEMEEKHLGKYVLMHQGEVQGIYDTSDDAYKKGCDKCGLGNFSTELVGQKPIDLGILAFNLNAGVHNANV